MDFVYAILWLAHENFLNFSTELWPLIDVKICQFLEEWMDFDKILFMHWYIWSMLWLTNIIFLNFSKELWPLIDFRIMFMLNILWNNCWIWSKSGSYIDIFYAKTCNNKNEKKGQ